VTGNGAFDTCVVHMPQSATFVMLNPLMPDINASTQRSLPRFLTQDFKFYCLHLGKKKRASLINFFFIFNEMKFCTVLMNWVIWENMLTYFYNKFRPVNHMHYIKCGVNSSLLT